MHPVRPSFRTYVSGDRVRPTVCFTLSSDQLDLDFLHVIHIHTYTYVMATALRALTVADLERDRAGSGPPLGDGPTLSRYS